MMLQQTRNFRIPLCAQFGSQRLKLIAVAFSRFLRQAGRSHCLKLIRHSLFFLATLKVTPVSKVNFLGQSAAAPTY